MKSHRVNTPQRMRALVLFGSSLGPTAIHSRLCEEFPEPVSLKTVKNWLADFRRAVDGSDGRESEIVRFLTRCESFTWSDFGQYGIPWEASEFIAELLVENVEIHSRNNTWCPIFNRVEILWLWRFHLVSPTLPITELMAMRDHIVLEETRSVLTGEPIDFDDIYWYLAYGPWESPEKQSVYDAAVAGHKFISRYDESFHQDKALEVMKHAGSLDPRSDLFDIAETTVMEVTGER